ncbi:MAG: hypothetical protein J0M35_08355 [Candidatus Obscuribacter phosphatis]|uniref:Uncharacterized protein n=1 Tax=Candidatus Obscuribacter phosphatis TaxID=1906157 RepID=A0A8J7PFG2_9BACT|nr:hypothetical protein [Candidatus Obscuribacter phosphatis]
MKNLIYIAAAILVVTLSTGRNRLEHRSRSLVIFGGAALVVGYLKHKV